MLLTFGIVMLIGLSATCKFLTGAPSTRKWPVAPESEMAYSTARLSLSILAAFCDLLEITTVSSSSSSLFANTANGFLLGKLVGAMVGVDIG